VRREGEGGEKAEGGGRILMKGEKGNGAYT